MIDIGLMGFEDSAVSIADQNLTKVLKEHSMMMSCNFRQ